MKFRTTLILLFLLAIHLTISAQINFEDHTIIDNKNATNRPIRISFGDIDGDGDLDLLSASADDDKIAWHENLDGLGTFSAQVVLSEECLSAKAVQAADFDGDGDLDVVSAASGGGFHGWITRYKNLDGLGGFGPATNLSTNDDPAGPNDVVVGDIDEDGTLDVIVCSEFGDNILWYQNFGGSGTFLGPALPIGNTINPKDLHIADIDDDGDIDILCASSGNDQILWYENDDIFDNFTFHSISSDADFANGVFASDLDGDGDLDVLSSSANDDKIAWYENLNGSGSFGSEIIITTTADGATSVFAADLDGDGDIDVLSSSADDNTIAWFENTNGQGNFGPKQILSSNAEGAQSVYVVDIDLDGDMDVFSVSALDDKISWFRNLDGQATFSEEIILTSIADTPNDVFAADLDNDGDLDALSASRNDNKIAWYENRNNGDFGKQQLISLNAIDAFSVSAADLDGDGDNDVLSTSLDDKKVAWYENTNGGGFETEHIISIEASAVYNAQAGDLDNDGDMDVVIITSTSVGWFENLNGQASFSAKQEFSTQGGWCDNLYLTDLDGDGDLDVHYPLRSSNLVLWHENTDGLGTFGASQIVSDIATSANAAHAADADGDGDMDIVSSLNDKVVWYKNANGLGSFADEIVVVSGNNSRSAFFADIDGDGDNDIVCELYGAYLSSWIENIDGLGNFGSPQPLTDESMPFRNAIPFDKDNDGDIDVLFASLLDNTIGWKENTLPTSNQLNGFVIVDTDLNGCDVNDPRASNIKIVTDNGSSELSTFSIDNGVYQMYPGIGDFTTVIDVPDYYMATPDSFTSNFTDLGNTMSNDFCLTSNQTINNLSVSIYPINEARPGFEARYRIVYQNTGTNVQSGAISLTFDDSKVIFTEATETVASQTNNTITFDFVDLDLFETRIIDVKFMLEQPPIAMLDDILSFISSISPVVSDYDPSDNTHTLHQVVIGSYDPNDIRVLEGDKIIEQETENYLHYIIRFQNTGTASAINVSVENVLDEDLDWNTFQMESSSHPHVIEILDGNQVSFIFDDINLADSTSNEPESHGFIAYKIKPSADVMLGTVFTSKADIYFDFNPAVETNTVTTTVVELDSIAPSAICQDISVYLEEDGTAEIEGTAIDNGSTDNIGIVAYTVDVNSFDCTNIGSITVNLTVTDDFDNSNSCMANIMVLDTLSPQNSVDVLPEINASCEVTDLIAPQTIDNCDGVIFGTHDTSLPITTQGTTIITWTYEDNNGNTHFQTQNVIIEDITPPIALSQDITIDLAGAASISIEAGQIDAGSSDNCGISQLLLDEMTFTVPGEYNILLTVQDINNNEANSTAIVTVIDSSTTSLQDLVFSASLTVAPNPAKGIVRIDSKNEMIASVVFYSDLGKVVKESASDEIDISALPAGKYILEIKSSDGKIAYKRIVKF